MTLIKTKIIEVFQTAGGMEQRELGFTEIGPIMVIRASDPSDNPPPQRITIGGNAYLIVDQQWEINAMAVSADSLEVISGHPATQTVTVLAVPRDSIVLMPEKKGLVL